jgi:hypothetical protein
VARIFIAGHSDEFDVTLGLRTLIKNTHEVSAIMLPAIGMQTETHDQVMMVGRETGVVVVLSDMETYLEDLEEDDVIALAWNESEECFEAIEAAIESDASVWDISNGLNPIEVNNAEEMLDEVIHDFVDGITAVVYSMVMKQLGDDGKFNKYRRS